MHLKSERHVAWQAQVCQAVSVSFCFFLAHTHTHAHTLKKPLFCLSLFNDGIRGENWWLKCSSSYLKKRRKERETEQEECEREKDGVGEKKKGKEVVVVVEGVLCTLGVFFKAVQT